jgi:ATP-binding cassette subfamily G (WHITE) protein 2 (SNQ2)
MYQASENMYEEFDKVCVIMEGRMIYLGLASQAKSYFEDLGFLANERQTTPDFLVGVTDKSARAFRPGYELRAPKTADELAQAYLKSDVFAEQARSIEEAESRQSAKASEAYRSNVRAEQAKHARSS